MRQLRNVEGVAAQALAFTILTAARSNEAKLATWDEIDFKNATWIVPPQRMKARREHRVALSQQAIALLRGLPRDGNLVFIGVKEGAAIGANALRQVLSRLRSGTTVHGFRATFKTWCEERTSFPNIVVEQSLAHAVGSAVERSYRRGDLLQQRQRLMQSWADYCDGPIGARGVTPLRGRS